MTLYKCMQEFLLFCKLEKNLSSKTISAYETDLQQLRKFLSTKKVSAISREDLRSYLAYRTDLKAKSIKRKIASMKAFFNYMEFEDKISVNPFRKMKIRIKEEKKLPSVMSTKEIFQILKKIYNKKRIHTDENSYSFFESIRNIIVIELLFNTGARVSEISGLKVDNINIDSGTILIRGKGNKERFIHIGDHEPISILKKYCQLFKKRIDAAGGYLLVNRFNKKLTDQSIRIIVRKAVIDAGINRHITPHVFRHSFATLLLEKDVDIRYIQSLLGHSSIMTTQIYTHVNRAKQKYILKTRHPRKDISMLDWQIE